MGERSIKAGAGFSPASSRIAVRRRYEAEQLMELAKGLLSEPEEEMAAIFLDHALEALRAIPSDPAHPGTLPSQSS